MAKPIFNSFFGRSLRTGSVVAGVGAVILSIIFFVLLFSARFTPKTILFDWLPPMIVKVVIAFNLCMTVLISIIMSVGAIKRNHYLMLPWVVLGCMLVVGLFLSIIYTGVKYIMDDLPYHAIAWFIIGFIFFIISGYMWCIAYSHFTVLREETKRGKYNRQPYRR